MLKNIFHSHHQQQTSVHYKKTPVQILLTVLMYISLIIATVIVILPIFIVLTSSFKNNAEIASTSPLLFPSNWRWSNYFGHTVSESGVITPSAWEYLNFKSSNPSTLGKAFIVTILISGVSILATVITGTLVAYVLSRFEFKGKKLLKVLFLVASIIPSITLQVSIFGLISKMGLYDSPLALILLYSGTDIISIYIFLQFLDNIPRALDEAALVDGCNYFSIYIRIILPLMKPAIATVCIIKGISFYNDFYLPSLYLKSYYTISTFLNMMNGATSTDWGVVCAGVVMAIIPTIVVFCFLQNQIYSGLTSGAVKS